MNHLPARLHISAIYYLNEGAYTPKDKSEILIFPRLIDKLTFIGTGSPGCVQTGDYFFHSLTRKEKTDAN